MIAKKKRTRWFLDMTIILKGVGGIAENLELP